MEQSLEEFPRGLSVLLTRDYIHNRIQTELEPEYDVQDDPGHGTGPVDVDDVDGDVGNVARHQDEEDDEDGARHLVIPLFECVCVIHYALSAPFHLSAPL